MKQIKKITQKARTGATPFVITSIEGELMTVFIYEHFNNLIQIHELEQTKKGVYVTLWLFNKDVKMFLSNTDIEIDYYD